VPKPRPRLINSFTRGIYPRQAECRFAVAAAQHLDERVQVQLFGTAPAVDHFQLNAQLARVDVNVGLVIGAFLVVEIAQDRWWRVGGTPAPSIARCGRTARARLSAVRSLLLLVLGTARRWLTGVVACQIFSRGSAVTPAPSRSCRLHIWRPALSAKP